MSNEIYNTIIIGGGAAGLFCGANLKLKNDKFLIIDKSPKAGLKLLVSGSGQCNFTHSGDIKEFINYYGDNGKRIRGILYRFNNLKVKEFFESRGVATTIREDGKIFPKSMKAEDVRGCLLEEIKNNNGLLNCDETVIAISKDDDVYCIKTDKSIYRCHNIVVATGGKSYPKTGSDGSFMDVLKGFDDFNIVKQSPALTQVYVEDYRYDMLSGISIENVEISFGKKKYKGDLLFTHRNFSGPAILNFSRYLNIGDRFKINYLPKGFVSGERLKCQGENRSILNYLTYETGLPKAFLEQIILKAGCSLQDKTSTIGGKTISKIENLLKGEEFVVSGKAGFKKAMVTAGGIALGEISTKTMESKKHPGLYFIGEVLDVDGDTGGYNIQFAFSSGYAAAQHILQLP